MNKILSLLMAFMFLSCTSGKTSVPGSQTQSAGSGTDASHYSVDINPKVATCGSTFSVIVSGFSLSDAKLEWLVNGAPVKTQVPHQFSATETKKADTVQLKAYVRGREVLSNGVTIGNALPVVTSARFQPVVFKAGDILRVEAEATDADGDSITLSYEWTRNGRQAGKEKSIDGPITRGDIIAVKITPFDGTDYGNTVVHEMKIQNFPPVIVDQKEFTFDGTVSTYQVRAFDPDGDAMTYSLVSPQAGMTIDSSTGLLKWTVPQEFKGVKDISVTVQDGHGGTAQYDLKITIK